MNKKYFLMLPLLAGFSAACLYGEENGTQTLHLIQDDAQDYMVSKTYTLKYLQANDIDPWVTGIVKRYNMNSTVGSLDFGSNNEQILTVTCPVGMMPYVDDFLAKADRKVEIDGKVPGEIIRGTGITRAVYRPQYRSGQILVDLIVNGAINEGPYGSWYGYDENSNQIYWKDNASNSEFVYQFLSFLDRPAPQITLHFTVFEVRESTLRDLGLEYLAWKNGPGLNIFETAFDAFSINSAGSAAINSLSGPVGGFFTAPQFDASFIRLLQQNGSAKITNSANLTVSNSDSQSYSLFFNPQLQNIVKNNNDRTSVTLSGVSLQDVSPQIYLEITAPTVNLPYGVPMEGYPDNEAFSVNPYKPGTYLQYNGTLFFSYDLETINAVERNNLGTELLESSAISGSVLIPLKQETVLGQWEKQQKVEQTIGIPFLSEIPLLKYLFSTTTTSNEQTKVYLTVTAEIQHSSQLADVLPGDLKQFK